MRTILNLNTLYKTLHGFLEERNRYVFAGVLLSLAILIHGVMILNIFPGYTYITIGRVTFKIYHPLKQFIENLAFLTYILALFTIPMILGFNRLSLLYILVNVILMMFSYNFSPLLMVIPLLAMFIGILLYVLRTNRYIKDFIIGLIYSIAGIEIVVLAHHIFLLSGFKLKLLSSLISFEIYSWSILWPSTLLILIISIILFFLTFRKPRKSREIENTNNSDFIYLMLGIVLATFIGIIGYTPTINPMKIPLNVDWLFYYEALQRMIESKNPYIEAFRAWPTYGDRPLYMILLYTISRILPIDIKTLCIYHNIALFQLYALSTYYMAKKIFGKNIARYAIIIAPATPNISSFIYGGFQANLFTLSLIQFSIGLFTEFKVRNIPLIIVLSLITISSHLYTWIHFAVLTAIYILILILIAIYRGILHGKYKDVFKLAISPIVFILTGLVLDMILGFILKEFKRIDIKMHTLQFLNVFRYINRIDLNKIWSQMEFYHNVYTGGSLNNPLYWILLLLSSILSSSTVITSIYTYISILLSIAMYAIVPLYSYRIEINTPTAYIVASLINSLGKTEKVFVILSLYSIALTKVICYIPNLNLIP